MKKAMKIFISIAMILSIAAILISCSRVPDCCAFAKSVDNLEDLKIIFGPDYLYSTTGKTNRLNVSCPHGPQNLNGYDKVEYIPFLGTASYYDVFGNFDVYSEIRKADAPHNDTTFHENHVFETVDGIDFIFYQSNIDYQAMRYYKNAYYCAIIRFPDNMPEEGEARDAAIQNIKKITIDYLLQLAKTESITSC